MCYLVEVYCCLFVGNVVFEMVNICGGYDYLIVEIFDVMRDILGCDI